MKQRGERCNSHFHQATNRVNDALRGDGLVLSWVDTAPVGFEDRRNGHLIAAIGNVCFQSPVTASWIRDVVEEHMRVPFVVVKGRGGAV